MIKHFLSAVTVAAFAFLPTHDASATTATWALATGGDWDVDDNWVGGVAPFGEGSVGVFNFTNSGAKTIEPYGIEGGDLTIGQITISSTASNYAIGGGNKIIFDNGSANGLFLSSTSTGLSTVAAHIVAKGPGLDLISGGTQLTFTGGVSAGVSGTTLLNLSNRSASSNFVFSGSITDGSAGGKLKVVVNSTTAASVNFTAAGGNSYTGGTHIERGLVGAIYNSFGTGDVTLGVNNADSALATTGTLTANSGGGLKTANNFIINGRTFGAGVASNALSRIGTGSGISFTGGGSAEFSGNFLLNSTLFLQGSASGGMHVSGNMSGDGGLYLFGNGSNPVRLSGSNTFTGQLHTFDNNLTFEIGNESATGRGIWTIGSNIATTTKVDNIATSGTGVLALKNSDYYLHSFIFKGSNDMSLGTGAVSLWTVQGALAGSTTITVEAKSLTIGGVISGGANTNAKNFGNAGAGTLILEGLNLYTGVTTVGGKLQINSVANGGIASAIGASGTAATTLVFNGGNLSYVGSGHETNRLFTVNSAGGGIESNGTGELKFTATGAYVSSATNDADRTFVLGGTNTGDNTLAGAFQNSTAKTLAVEKRGLGRWILTGTHSYSGATTVNAGTLEVAGEGHINSSAVTVNKGGTFVYNSSVARTGAITLNGDGAERATLGGSGRINTAVALTDVGSTLSPGNSPGRMTFGASQSWDSFTYLWEINDFEGSAGTNFDQIAVEGGLTLGGGSHTYKLDLISLTLANGSDTTKTWTILTTTDGITGFNRSDWEILAAGLTSATPLDGQWDIGLAGNDLYLQYTSIPEPSAVGLVLAGIGAAYALRRRGV